MKTSWKRALIACERVADTRSQLVTLLDWSSGRPYGNVRRSTCEAMAVAGLLDEDQSLLHGDGHGSFKFVLTRAGVTELMGVAARFYVGRDEPYCLAIGSCVLKAKTPAELHDKIATVVGIK